MTETKWTPGPWEFAEWNTGRSFYDCWGLFGNDGQPLGVNVDSCGYINTLEECKANATLVATAPELYDALDEAVIALEMVHSMHKMTETKLLKHLKAVLSKARGDQQ